MTNKQIKVNITFTNKNPDTIYNRLAAKIGREPTRVEIVAELDRIRGEARKEMVQS